MTEFVIFIGGCMALLIWQMWREKHGRSESAREIRALLREQRREALRARRKYPYTVAGCRH